MQAVRIGKTKEYNLRLLIVLRMIYATANVRIVILLASICELVAKNMTFLGWGCAWMAQSLPSMSEALASISRLTNSSASTKCCQYTEMMGVGENRELFYCGF